MALAPSQVTARLAAFAAELTYDQLPAEALTAARSLLLDCLGTTLAGSALGSGVGQLLAVVRAMGGHPESTILGAGLRAPAPLAALANGGLAHALNYDDFLPEGGVHLSVCAVPAALALAERRGRVSGKELIAAVAAGSELMARLGIAVQRMKTPYAESRPQISQLLGHFAAAASAGRILRLSAEQMHSALGLAHMQSSGGRQPVVEGSEAKALYAAFPGQAGVLSALLAQAGLEAACAAFEGEAGLFATSYRGSYDASALDEGLGTTFHFAGVTFKPWPTTVVSHVFIEGAIELAQQHDLRPRDVAAIHLTGQDHIRTFCEPAVTRQRPRTSVEAEDSLPFAVAKALTNRQLTLADVQPEGLRQPETLSLAARVSYRLNGSLDPGGVLEVTTTDGRRLQTSVERPLGFPPRALTYDQLAAKFRDCASYALEPVSPAAVEQTIRLVAELDRLDDVSLIVRTLSAR